MGEFYQPFTGPFGLNIHRQRFLVPLCLFAIWLLGYLGNNFSDFWMPHGSDEMSYVGFARRFIFFENRSIYLLPFQDTAYLNSYWVGLISFLGSVAPEITSRLFHGVLLLLITLVAYQIGKKANTLTGLLFSGLVSFSFTPVFYPGQAYLTSSLFLNLGLLLMLLHLLERRWRWLVLDLLLLLFFYWYGFLVCLGFLVVALGVFYSRKTLLIGLPIMAFLCVIKPLTLLETFGGSFLSEYIIYFQSDYSSDYLSRLWSNYGVYLIPFLLALFPLFQAHAKPTRRLIQMGVALLVTNVFFYFSINPYLQLRTLFFFYVGLFLLTSVGLSLGVQWIQSRKPRFKPAASVALGLFLLFIAYKQVTVYAIDIAPIPPFDRSEIEAFEWLNSHEPNLDQALLVTDASTMHASLGYVNSLNSFYLESDPLSGQAEGLGTYFMTDKPQMKFFYSLLERGYFSSDDFEELGSIQEDLNAQSVFVVITPRTRKELYYRELGVSLGAWVLDAHYDYPVFYGESKFSESYAFEALFDNGGTQIYQYILGET